MIINELLLDIFRHSSERVVDPLMILSHVLVKLLMLKLPPNDSQSSHLEGGGDQALQLGVLLLRHVWVERKSLHRPPAPDPGGDHVLTLW